MEAYSDKLRELVLECYEEGLGTVEIAKRFKVSCDWVRRVRRRWLEDEIRTVIKQKHGPDPLMDEVRRQELTRLVEQTPDAIGKYLLFASLGVVTLYDSNPAQRLRQAPRNLRIDLAALAEDRTNRRERLVQRQAETTERTHGD